MTEPTLLPCPFCGSQLVPSLGLPDGTYQHADNVRECIIGDLAVTDKDFWNRRAFAADALDAADARALLAREQAATGWQPIETAPKDGTPVLLWASNGATTPFVAAYLHDRWRNNHYGAREPYWYFGAPTHWMPLPAPPGQEPT